MSRAELPEASLRFCRDVPGLEFPGGVGSGARRRLTVGPPHRPGDADVVQEPTGQPYGVRDCAVRHPAGTLLRIQQLP